MNNPFASLDLRPLRARRASRVPKMSNLDRQLNLVNVSKPSGVRDWVILLLRNKYKFLPGEISKLDLSDVDLSGGIIYIVRQRKKQIVVVDERDLFAFQRWIVVRKLFVSNTDAFLISMHWTRGRAEPYQRISVRGVFLVVQKYASESQNQAATQQVVNALSAR